MAAGGKFPPSAEAVENLRIFLDRSLPPDRRIIAGKAVLYGPQSNPDLRLNPADTSKMASMQFAATDPKSVPLESWWPGGKGPVLVIQGLSDVIAPPENGRSLKIDYPDRVTLIELAGLGHLMHRERPDLVAEAIIAFVHGLGN
jgi:pimeloyl-ACP methyl ester carboxylesterase